MLAIAKTPVRISFFGGGTDYPEYLENNVGAVLGTTINKYIYTISLPTLVGYAEYRYRVSYRHIETVNTIEEIAHPAIRATLKTLDYNVPLNISIVSDMPAGTGLGSSSAFTVGFINLIQTFKQQSFSRYDLAQMAIHIEHDVLKENVGVQDQVHAAFGGLAHYTFQKNQIMIRPVNMHTECRALLNRSMLLVHSGTSRHASASVDEQIANTKAKKLDRELSHLVKMTHDGLRVLELSSPDQVLKLIGEMLSEAWLTKRGLSSKISNGHIDEIYEKGIKLGAYGGKLCGAGNGGFFLFLVPPYRIPAFLQTFGEEYVVRIELEDYGSTIAFK